MTMEVAVEQRSRRELCMEYVWGRCERAWIEGDFDQANHLSRMHSAFEQMTDAEYERTYVCECADCHCEH